MLAYSGRGRFKVELTDLNRLVRAATDLLLPAIPKGVSLDYDLAAEVPPVEADVGQIRQAIVNLVTNAFEAMGEHPGTVALTTRRLSCDRACLAEFLLGRDLSPGDYVCLEVADSGCGMDRAAVDRVFEPFYTTKFTGRGLGLSVVLGIVRGHGGAIRVQSTPGKGTRVSVLLPSGGAVPLPVAGTEPADGPATWQGRGTVLLVDDEVAVRTAAQRLLERLGLRVRVATSGREAVLIFRQEAAAISCVLLDLTMPGLDGEQTLAALREVQSDARVILASGYSEQDVSERFAGKGLVAVLHKPYELQALVAALRKAIEC
jgi:CheY-like chemotaxis protein